MSWMPALPPLALLPREEQLMCLGLPGKVVNTLDDRGTPMGISDLAISELDEAAAADSLRLWEELGFVAPFPEEPAQ